MNVGRAEERVLLAGLPQRHLGMAVDVCRAHGRVVIPAGSPGDLDEATSGMDVYLMISGDDAVPAVTWRATFVRRIAPAHGDELPDLLPPSWLEERRATTGSPREDDAQDDGDDEDDEDDETGRPQSFFEVERLEPLPKSGWIFANELVPKQERGGRAFYPRAPRLIRPPD